MEGLNPGVRLVLQRVTSAAVLWQDDTGASQTRRIGRGLAILVGAAPEDEDRTLSRIAAKVAQLRIFSDVEGRMNRSLEDIGGEALVVSQFTLFADTSKGRRPSYLGAGDPVRAQEGYEAFARALADRGIPTATGKFGAHMLVSIENDGPLTLVLSTDEWRTRIGG